MKTFACGAVVAGCTATFEAESDEALFAQIAEHARVDHGIEQVSPELVEEVRRHIRTT